MIGEGSHEKLVEKLGAGALCGMAVDSIRFFSRTSKLAVKPPLTFS